MDSASIDTARMLEALQAAGLSTRCHKRPPPGQRPHEKRGRTAAQIAGDAACAAVLAERNNINFVKGVWPPRTIAARGCGHPMPND
jgi:hypothetical protein